MELEESQRLVREVARQFTACLELGDAVDVIMMEKAEVAAAKVDLKYLAESTKQAKYIRDEILKEIEAFKSQLVIVEKSFENKYTQYESAHNDKIDILDEEHNEKKRVYADETQTLEATSSSLKSTIVKRQRELDDINEQLNTINKMLDKR